MGGWHSSKQKMKKQTKEIYFYFNVKNLNATIIATRTQDGVDTKLSNFFIPLRLN